jgi:hypothetical protein
VSTRRGAAKRLSSRFDDQSRASLYVDYRLKLEWRCPGAPPPDFAARKAMLAFVAIDAYRITADLPAVAKR